ncbi:putative amino acid permease YhdG [subsurface metagenome]
MVSNIILMTGGKLKRELNLGTLTAAMIGLNIGGSLFVLTAIAAGLTGPSLFISQIISALPILLALIPYLMLTSAIPTNCGNYQYAKLFSRPLAVAGWWGLFIAIPFGAMPLFALATAKLLIILMPGLPLVGTAVIVLTVFFVINVIGVKATAYVQSAAVAILVIALVVFIVQGIPVIEARNLTPMFTGGAIGLVGAAALLYTLLAGGLFGIEMGDEVKNAKTTIPRALIISIAIVLVIYLLIEVIAVGVIDFKAFAGGGTLGTPAEAFLSIPLLGFFVIGGGILASTTTINLTLTAAGRYILASAEDRFFPRFFSSINQKFGTPHWGLTLAYVLSVISLAVNPSLQTLAAMLNFGLLFMVTLVLLAAFRLPKTHPDIYENAKFKFGRKTLAITSLLAVAINIIFIAILAVAVLDAFLIFAGFVIFGLALYLVRRRQLGIVPSLVSVED